MTYQLRGNEINKLLPVDRTLEDIEGDQPVDRERREDGVALSTEESCTTCTGVPSGYLTPTLPLLSTGRPRYIGHRQPGCRSA